MYLIGVYLMRRADVELGGAYIRAGVHLNFFVITYYLKLKVIGKDHLG